MDEARTTAAIEQYLLDLAGTPESSPAEPVVRALLGRAVNRLRFLSSALLHKSYARLTRPPLNLKTDELLSSVVERLLKALAKERPPNVRAFFALANRHMRWELNDLARRLDKRAPEYELIEGLALAPESSGSGISVNARRMLDAIENLPDEEREVFSLVRIQGMTHVEVAELVGVSSKTVQRRLNQSLLLLWDMLPDLHPGESPADDSGAGDGQSH